MVPLPLFYTLPVNLAIHPCYIIADKGTSEIIYYNINVHIGKHMPSIAYINASELNHKEISTSTNLIVKLTT